MTNALNTTAQPAGPKLGLNTYTYGSGQVRTAIDVNGEPWWVGKDILTALGYAEASITNVAKMFAHVPVEWQGRYQITTPSGNQEMITLNESGVFFFLSRSDKPTALLMQKWVAQTLPGIRKANTRKVETKTTVASELRSSIYGFHSTMWEQVESLVRQNVTLAAMLDQANGMISPSEYSKRAIQLDVWNHYAFETEKALGITRGKLLPFLQDQGILIWDSATGYQPTTKYFHQGYFLYSPTRFRAGSTWNSELQITAKGRLWLFFNANRGWLTSILMRKVRPTLTTPVAQKPLPVSDFWLDLR